MLFCNDFSLRSVSTLLLTFFVWSSSYSIVVDSNWVAIFAFRFLISCFCSRVWFLNLSRAFSTSWILSYSSWRLPSFLSCKSLYFYFNLSYFSYKWELGLLPSYSSIEILSLSLATYSSFCLACSIRRLSFSFNSRILSSFSLFFSKS